MLFGLLLSLPCKTWIMILNNKNFNTMFLLFNLIVSQLQGHNLL